jgi:DNA-binding protein YbaB
MPDDVLDLLDERQEREGFAQAEQLRRQFDGLLDVQRAERYSARSPRQEATATVDGTGHVLDLRIDDHALRRGHPGLVGLAITQAIAAARMQAATHLKQRITPLLNGDATPDAPIAQPPPVVPVSPPVVPVPPRRRSRQRPDDDDDEPFDIFAGHRPGRTRR